MSDLEAFEAMMRANGPRIYSLALRLTGRSAEGEDLAQETFVQAFHRWSQFRGESDPGTWLFRICVNLWKNRVRYEKRRFFSRHVSLNAPSPDGEEATRELPAEEPGVEQPIEQADTRRAVQEALAALDPEDRAVLVLREMDDKPYEEIALSLDVPLGTVKSRLARAREKIRKILERTLNSEKA